VRTYADSSFILRLVLPEATSGQVIAEYRRLGKPRIFFLPLHSLEVRNAIIQREFFQKRSPSVMERRQAAREREAATKLLNLFLTRRTLVDATIDWEGAFAASIELVSRHSDRVGARAIDLLHVANALLLKAELFFTTDARQSQIAKAEGLNVVYIH
jgi:hypothetical protein